MSKNKLNLPLILGSNNELAEENIKKFYENNEKSKLGGYFPIGSNTTWHGGIHTHLTAETDIYSVFKGQIIAAKLSPKLTTAEEQAYGSSNFILMKHSTTGHELNQQSAPTLSVTNRLVMLQKGKGLPLKTKIKGGSLIGYLTKYDVIELLDGKTSLNPPALTSKSKRYTPYTKAKVKVIRSAESSLVGKTGYVGFSPGPWQGWLYPFTALRINNLAQNFYSETKKKIAQLVVGDWVEAVDGITAYNASDSSKNRSIWVKVKVLSSCQKNTGKKVIQGETGYILYTIDNWSHWRPKPIIQHYPPEKHYSFYSLYSGISNSTIENIKTRGVQWILDDTTDLFSNNVVVKMIDIYLIGSLPRGTTLKISEVNAAKAGKYQMYKGTVLKCSDANMIDKTGYVAYTKDATFTSYDTKTLTLTINAKSWRFRTQASLDNHGNERDLPTSSQFKIVPGQDQKYDKKTWKKITVTQSTSANLVPSEGYVTENALKKTTPIYNVSTDMQTLATSALANSVKNTIIKQNEKLWSTTAWGPKGKRTHMLDWQIFSEANLFEPLGWEKIIDGDDDLFIDAAKLIALIPQLDTKDKQLSSKEVKKFYNSGAGNIFHEYAVKFITEWGYDIQTLLSRLTAEGYAFDTKKLTQKTEPYLWWNQLVGKDHIPKTKKLWHYHPVTAIAQINKNLQKVEGIPDSAINRAAQELGIDAEIILAIGEKETHNHGFMPDGRPVAKLESHKLNRYLRAKSLMNHAKKNHPLLTQNDYGFAYPPAEYNYRVQPAIDAYQTSGILASSWGRYQVMGFNYKTAGYASAEEFYQAMMTSELEHLNAFKNFVLANPKVHKAMKNKNWDVIAETYNGPQYKNNKYDTALKNFYKAFSTPCP